MSRRRVLRKARALYRKRRTRPGLPPGTVTAPPGAAPTQVHVIGYSPTELHEAELTDLAQLAALREAWPVLWVDVRGLGDAALLRRLGEAFAIHSLALEDVVNVHQRPKLEAYEDHEFLVLRMLRRANGHLDSEQLSVFLCEGAVITFQERQGDCFEAVRQRIRKKRGRLRVARADYLVYALVDAVVDQVFPVLDQYGERLMVLEDEVLAHVAPHAPRELYLIRRELMAVRRVVWPLRDVLGRLARGDVSRVSPETQLYFRDTSDHAFQLLEILEACREATTGLVDLQLNSISQRMNEVMKVLTVIATIFIPLSFIAGVYGMNFDASSPYNMPELRWRFGYPFALALMAAVAGSLVLYFLRKGWIGSGLSKANAAGEAAAAQAPGDAAAPPGEPPSAPRSGQGAAG